VSTKIHSTGGIPALPAFVIYGRKVGERERNGAASHPAEEARTFGRTLYSPRHHIDAQGRPIPVRISSEGRYVPSKRPATAPALDKPAPVAPAVRTAKRFKAVTIPTNTQRSR